jgi:hypothetical protein
VKNSCLKIKIRKAQLAFFKISPIIRFKKVLQAWKFVFLAGIIFLLCVSPSLGQNTFNLEIDSASRGTTLIVTSDPPITSINPENIFLMLNGKKATSANAIREDRKEVEFVIPKNIELNSYSPTIDIVSDQMTKDGQSNSQAKKMSQLALEVIYPKSSK